MTTNIFLKAAMRLEKSFYEFNGNHTYACLAITQDEGNSPAAYASRELFAEYFQPPKQGKDVPWFGRATPKSFFHPTARNAAKLKERKEQRVLALLFMHEIAKDL